MSESQLTAQLQIESNIDKIRDACQKVKVRKFIQRKRDAEDELQELDFDEDLH